MKLAVIGLGYVGLSLDVDFGQNRTVIGFDINPSRIDELRAGEDRTLEVEQEDLLAAKLVHYTADPNELAAANVFVVTVPTPIDEYKQPQLEPLIRASETIGKVLKKGDIVRSEERRVGKECREE